MSFAKSLDQRLVTARKYVLAVGVCLVAFVTPLAAQDAQQLTGPKVEGKVILGSAIFKGDLEHKIVGGAVRIYLTKRVSIEPEYLYLRHSDNDEDQLIQPNIAVDFTDPTKRFVVYGIAGLGVLKHKGRFFGNDFETGAPRVFDNSFTGWTGSAGGGVKIFLTKRLFVSPEVRVGREPIVRATINVGFVFAGKN